MELKHGQFDYYGYFLVRSSGLEICDHKVVLDSYKRKSSVYSACDPDVKLSQEITGKILEYCEEIEKEMENYRVIVTKENKNAFVSISK
jgi:hypothetical protein